MRKSSSAWAHSACWEYQGEAIAGGWKYVKGTWEKFLIAGSSSGMMFLGLVQGLQCLSKSMYFLKTLVPGVPDANAEPWNVGLFIVQFREGLGQPGRCCCKSPAVIIL